jgi:bifunctional N-acetylglucosamine-1-phosphate-uridyltransferase/glucosamine-1-phosphate-acetyltransferase GlmU-like protein
MGKSLVGENTVIMPGAWVKDSIIGINCTIGQSAVIEGTTVVDGSIIEPFRRV